MINLENKGPFISRHLQRFGFSIKQRDGIHYAATTKGQSGDDIDAVAQSIIDAFDPIAADKEQRINEIDEKAKLQAWRPIASDIMRIIDARQFDADGRPAKPESDKYLWLIDAATAKGVTLTRITDMILNKETAARLIEKKRLDDKAAIRA